MSTIITDGSTVASPTVVDGFNSTRDPGVRVHPILGSSLPDITYQAAQLRTGTLRMMFTSESEALAAETLHIGGNVLSIVSTERAAVNFSYVPVATVRLELDPETRNLWLLEVDYQEVTG